MKSLVRFRVLFVLSLAILAAVPAAADYDGPDGYGDPTSVDFDVSHDGYLREGQTGGAPETTTYVVIEADEGQPEQVDGETVIVVQEPEPIAATEHAPPAPRTVVVEQAIDRCPGGIWVDGYWAYGNGDYVWVDGHCVVERVNYVFVQPRWDFYSSVWWFVPGYYRPCGVYVGFGYYRPWYWYPPYYGSHYGGRYPVAVHRSVPRRPTAVRATPSARTPSRGVLRRPAGQSTAVGRRPPASRGRTNTVDRVGAAPTRGGGVSRTPTVARARPSATRVDSVNRGRPTPSRTTVVGRPPASSSRAGAVTRRGSSPTVTGTVPRSPPRNVVASQARTSPARTGSVQRPASPSSARPSVSRPARSPSRSSSVSRASGNPSRSSSVRRPSMGSQRGGSIGRPAWRGSRPSMGGRGGFSRPSSGGFGGARSVPTARGR